MLEIRRRLILPISISMLCEKYDDSRMFEMDTEV
jgi:hypothetical protein